MSINKAITDIMLGKKRDTALEGLKENTLFEESTEGLNPSKLGDAGSKAASLAQKDKSKSSVAGTTGDSTQPKQGSSETATVQDFDEEDIGTEAAKPVTKDNTLPKSKGDAKSVKTPANESSANENLEDLDEGKVHPADAHRILNATGGVDTDHHRLSLSDVSARMDQAKEAGYTAKGDSATGRSKAYRTTLHLQRQAAKYNVKEEATNLEEAAKSVPSAEAADELHLYATNDSDLYNGHAQQVIKNLAKKKHAGTYDHERAITAWEHHANAAAAKHVKEHGTPGDKPHEIFNAATRRLAAKSMRDHYDEHVNDHVEKLKAAKGSKTVKEESDSPVYDLDEQLNLIFGDDISEEFKEKASTIFEAAVVARVNEEMDAVITELEEAFEEKLSACKEEIVEGVDTYINYAVNHWLEENKVAVDTGLKSELTEDFISGLKTLFNEHYIDVPEDKVDLIGELHTETEELKQELNSTLEESIRLQKNIDILTQQLVISEMTAGMISTDADRFEKLIEGVEFDSKDLYREKLTVIKESYFKKSIKQDKPLFEETQTSPSPLIEGNDVMSKYALGISRTIKK